MFKESLPFWINLFRPQKYSRCLSRDFPPSGNQASPVGAGKRSSSSSSYGHLVLVECTHYTNDTLGLPAWSNSHHEGRMKKIRRISRSPLASSSTSKTDEKTWIEPSGKMLQNHASGTPAEREKVLAKAHICHLNTISCSSSLLFWAFHATIPRSNLSP